MSAPAISLYQQGIIGALTSGPRPRLDRADPLTARLVEDVMRTNTGGVLDHLTKADFNTLARECLEELDEYPHMAALICDAGRISRPAWLVGVTAKP